MNELESIAFIYPVFVSWSDDQAGLVPHPVAAEVVRRSRGANEREAHPHELFRPRQELRPRRLHREGDKDLVLQDRGT